jgi:AcrR family transcriptional regulator
LLGATEPEGSRARRELRLQASRRFVGLFLVCKEFRYRSAVGGAPDRRDRIVDVAMRHFAERGYRGTRVEDVASEAGVAKGTVFLDFGSKEGLFLAVYRRAVSMLPAWLDAPSGVTDRGFWATLDWWLQRTEDQVAEDPVPNRVALIGRYDTGLGMRRPIGRLMHSEDPFGTLEFVEFGVERGEIRDDVDTEMLAATLDWMAERFQDALISEELDPGLIHRHPERRGMRIKEFVEVLRDGISAADR